MKTKELSDGELRLMKLVWDNPDITSSQLVKLCKRQLGWEKSTVYTVLKRAAQKGFVQNVDGVVSALVTKAEAEKDYGDRLVNEMFSGSLPGFIAAFMQDKKLTKEQAQKLKELIDSYTEE